MTFLFIDSVGHYEQNTSKYSPIGTVPTFPVEYGFGHDGGRSLTWRDSGWGLQILSTRYNGPEYHGADPTPPYYGAVIWGALVTVDLTTYPNTHPIVVSSYCNPPSKFGSSLLVTPDGKIQVWNNYGLTSQSMVGETAAGTVPSGVSTYIEWSQGICWPLTENGTIVCVNEEQVLALRDVNNALTGSPALGPWMQPAGTHNHPLLAMADIYARGSSTFYASEYPYGFQGRGRVLYQPAGGLAVPWSSHAYVWRDQTGTIDVLSPVQGITDPTAGQYDTDYYGNYAGEASNLYPIPTPIDTGIDVDPTVAQTVIGTDGRADPTHVDRGLNVAYDNATASGIGTGIILGNLHRPSSNPGGDPIYWLGTAPAAIVLGSRLPTPDNPVRNFFNGLGWLDSTDTPIYAANALRAITNPPSSSPPHDPDVRFHQVGMELFLPGNPGPISFGGGGGTRAAIVGL
jgi:hypothetical protein